MYNNMQSHQLFVFHNCGFACNMSSSEPYHILELHFTSHPDQAQQWPHSRVETSRSPSAEHQDSNINVTNNHTKISKKPVWLPQPSCRQTTHTRNMPTRNQQYPCVRRLHLASSAHRRRLERTQQKWCPMMSISPAKNSHICPSNHQTILSTSAGVRSRQVRLHQHRTASPTN